MAFCKVRIDLNSPFAKLGGYYNNTAVQSPLPPPFISPQSTHSPKMQTDTNENENENDYYSDV